MKFTIDTTNKTIQIIGSFTYKDFEKMRNSLIPTEWADYTFEQPKEVEYLPPHFPYKPI